MSAPARAELLTSAISAVGVALPPNAQVPISLALVDDGGARRTLAQAMNGRPALLILADYTCRTLCGPVLAQSAAALEQSGLKPGADYRLVVVGLDPKDQPADARAMKAAQIGQEGPLAEATTFLLADETTLGRVTTSLGYRASHDSETDQFAHPAAVFVLTSDGHVARALSGLGLDPDDLRLALVEAGEGRIGSAADQVRLLCYGFDPAIGIYTLSVHRLLALGWLLTAAGLATGIGIMALRAKRTSA